LSRVSLYAVPARPQYCTVEKDCVYRIGGVGGGCQDPRTNKGNSDAACHRMNNKDLIVKLRPVGGKASD
jgi:hypothetical protein